jgi:hypothetical protein
VGAAARAAATAKPIKRVFIFIIHRLFTVRFEGQLARSESWPVAGHENPPAA